MSKLEWLLIIAVCVIAFVVTLLILLDRSEPDNSEALVEQCEMLVTLAFDEEVNPEDCEALMDVFYTTYKKQVDECFRLYDDSLLVRCIGQIADK